MVTSEMPRTASKLVKAQTSAVMKSVLMFRSVGAAHCRSTELPTDKAAPIVVYCRSGNESAVASQTLVDLGYTDIANLDGGMTAWVAGGGRLVQVAH